MRAFVEQNGPVSTGVTTPRPDRRKKARVVVPFRATVQGRDAAGVPFEASTVADNLSAGGLYLRIMWEVMEGANLLINLSLAGEAGPPESHGLSLEVYGRVIRVDPMSGGAFGVAVTFSSSIFL